MKVLTEKIEINTRGKTDIIDITHKVQEVISRSGIKEGNALVFAVGSTAGITTIEYEPGLLKDLPELFEKLIPSSKTYHHDSTWGDGNGYAHLRASMLGASLQIPFSRGELLLGTWQQIVFIDFDNRPRQRRIIVQLIGE
ncbi:MAG: secondary thiamine-phosphate synthase enzyme YjbQ [Ignavibacteria bacterium]|nr:secondary thiamine-phosphate synthase enzyme YjbQ [Ignavibacteria bacterium]